MLLFSHIGITLGVATVISSISKVSASEVAAGDNVGKPCKSISGFAIKRMPSFKVLAQKFDIRALLIGSILPDMIDKPIGHLILADTLNNGRLFSHSLLFFLLVLLSGLFLYSRNKNTILLVVSFGVLLHLILDYMWADPQALLWPLLGTAFESGTTDNYFLELLNNLKQPANFVPEAIGLLTFIGFVVWLIKTKNMLRFIRQGRI